MLAMFLWAFGIYLSGYVGYQLLLFAANALISDSPEFEPSRFRRFNIIVPAHNEQLFLPRLLSSLQSQAYPRQQYRVTVVADNCTDGTLTVCQPFDATVLERTDQVRRGKGYAIRWALERIDVDQFDAIVIVDGDSVVATGFLKHVNLQMDQGDRVVQCYNGVANPRQSWFTRLMDVSRTIANDIVHPGKRKLGLSSHLMGNGMAFDIALFKAQPWSAFSVGEDWEYYARLILSGAYIGYSRHARVYHQESVNLQQASSQRLRWSSGRFQVLRQYGLPLLRRGVRTRSLQCLDASLPLVFPNPSLAINLTFVGMAVAGLYWSITASATLVLWYLALTLLQIMMFIIGVLRTQDRAANAVSILLAPLFLTWKMGIDIVSFFGIGRKEWNRTERRLS